MIFSGGAQEIYKILDNGTFAKNPGNCVKVMKLWKSGTLEKIRRDANVMNFETNRTFEILGNCGIHDILAKLDIRKNRPQIHSQISAHMPTFVVIY